MVNARSRDIFKQSSSTYYYASWFFPEPIRSQVFDLYAYVRTADNYVDNQSADRAGFYSFVRSTEKHWFALTGEQVSGSMVQDLHANILTPPVEAVVTTFVLLAHEKNMPWRWIRAFLLAMEADLYKNEYHTIEETLHYIYGSAEVIGLMLSQIFSLPRASHPTARMLGRSMQFINMIRDVKEDRVLNRTYLPLADLRQFELDELTVSAATAHPGKFSQFLRFEISRYQLWGLLATAGFHFLPRSLRIPVQTATQMYDYTARMLEKDPLLVWHKKVKPSPLRVITRGLINARTP